MKNDCVPEYHGSNVYRCPLDRFKLTYGICRKFLVLLQALFIASIYVIKPQMLRFEYIWKFSRVDIWADSHNPNYASNYSLVHFCVLDENKTCSICIHLDQKNCQFLISSGSVLQNIFYQMATTAWPT